MLPDGGGRDHARFNRALIAGIVDR